MIHELLIGAARELFCSQGYSNTSTREIADLAGTSETHLFRVFGSKANLFEKAIFEPVIEFVTGFVAKWRDAPERPAADVAEEYILGLYRLFRENRGMMMALLTAHMYENRVGEKRIMLDPPLGRVLSQVEEWAEQVIRVHGSPDFDARVGARALFAMVFGMAVLDDWLFPAGSMPSEGRVVHTISDWLVLPLGDEARSKD